MTPIACPRCGGDNIQWPANIDFNGDEYLDADVCQCNVCGCQYSADPRQWWPDNDDDDICNADDGIIDDEDAAYAPPADSRESEE